MTTGPSSAGVALGPVAMPPLPKGTAMNWHRTVETVKQLMAGEEQ